MQLSPRPDASLGLVLPAVADAMGVHVWTPELSAIGHDGPTARKRLNLERGSRFCVVLVDGLGWHQLRERGGHAPFLRSLLGEAAVLHSAFPATTATSMGLFGTGLLPGKTGLAGYTVRDPGSGKPVNLLQWDSTAVPEQWQTHPTIFEFLSAAQIATTFVGESKFARSGLTRAALRGARFLQGGSPSARADVVTKALRNSPEAVVYLYWGELDRIGHQRGVGSWEWGDALTELNSALASIARSMPAGTQLIVTADHGMIDLPQTGRYDVAHEPELAADVELVAGEHRAAHLYCARDCAPDVARRWEDWFAGRAMVATKHDAIAAGWFGEVDAAVEPILGDVIVVPTDSIAILDSRRMNPSAMRLIGLHGSMAEEESAVPFIKIVASGGGRG